MEAMAAPILGHSAILRLDVRPARIQLRKQAGLLSKQTGLHGKQAGLHSKQAGLHRKQAGLQRKQAGLLSEQARQSRPVFATAARASSSSQQQQQHRLREFQYWHGQDVVIQTMREGQAKETEDVLVDSFAELMGGGLLTYRPLLALTVRQYLRDRLRTFPDTVTLVALFCHGREWILAGTVEVCLQNVAGNPVPYLCNMAVMKEFRRRGLGRQLLRAAEHLTATLGWHHLYLHCRLVDAAPLSMYRQANYRIVATDNLFHLLLRLQRRRHLLKKMLFSGQQPRNGSASLSPINAVEAPFSD